MPLVFRFPRPPPARILLFPLTSHLVLSPSPLLLLPTAISSIFLPEPRRLLSLFSSSRHSWGFFFRICASFFLYSLYTLIRALTRYNSQLHLPRPENSSRSVQLRAAFAFPSVLAHARPSEEVSGMKFRVAMSKSLLLRSVSSEETNRKFLSSLANKYSLVYYDISHGARYIGFSTDVFKACGKYRKYLFPHEC